MGAKARLLCSDLGKGAARLPFHLPVGPHSSEAGMLPGHTCVPCYANKCPAWSGLVTHTQTKPDRVPKSTRDPVLPLLHCHSV